MSYNSNTGPAQWPSPNDPTNQAGSNPDGQQPKYYPPTGYAQPNNYQQPQPPFGYNYQQYPYTNSPQAYGYQPSLSNLQAGVGSRFWALVIDSLIVSIITGIIFAPLGRFSFWHYFDHEIDNSTHLGTILQFVVLGIYATLTTVYLGGTIGKRLLGLRVVNLDGSTPTLNTYVLRYIVGYPVSAVFLMLGFIWAFFDSQKQAWHDKIAKTYVVKA